MLGIQDIEDSVVDDNFMEDEDQDRFKVGRDGDHLMTLFQCDECHFGNVMKRVSGSNPVDELARSLIRRANLDSMWSRERSTVYGNMREGSRCVLKGRMAGIQDPYPARGPARYDDGWGMATAMVMLLRSLDAGKNASTIQFDTARGVRTHMSNYWHSSATGMEAVLVSSDGTISDVSNAPTNSFWFRRFIRGCHRRMGDIWKPNRPLLIEELKACLAILEEDWNIYSKMKRPDVKGMLRAARTATMLISGFFAALRGEEICRVDVGSMRLHWDESQNHPGAPHVPLMMAGRFKGDHTEKLFCQPLANVTKTGINIKLWTERTLQVLDAVGIKAGPMFRDSTTKRYRKATISDLDVDFHWILKRVQKKHPTMLPSTGSNKVDIINDFSVMRSLQRGATAHACNMKVPESVVEANNRWRKHMRSKGMRPQMSMMKRYSDAKASVPSLTRFSGEM